MGGHRQTVVGVSGSPVTVLALVHTGLVLRLLDTSFDRGSALKRRDRAVFDRAEDQPRMVARAVRETGVHRGRGPRGYRRTDERILEEVNERLTEDAHLDATNIEVDVRDGEVTLKGFS